MKRVYSLILIVSVLFTMWIPTVNAEETDYSSLVDFVVEVEEGVAPRILQITDTQIIDSTQCRTEDRLGSSSKAKYSPDKMEENCFSAVRQVVEEFKPHLIILTGDFVYGEFDDNGSAFIKQVEFFDSLKTPWAPVFGNHDQESAMGADWQCQQFEKSPYCLFKQRTLYGNGNYTVGVMQGGELKRVFVMLDSNGCGAMSDASKANGHAKTSVGFSSNQIEWFKETMENIKSASPNTKLSTAFHIQLNAFQEAMETYKDVWGETDDSTEQISLNLDEVGKAGDYGYLGRDTKSNWDKDNYIFKTFKNLGVDSIFNGHEHCNNGSIVYEGVRLVYGLKSSVYDRYNLIAEGGGIVDSTVGGEIPYIGGTAITLDENGNIDDIYNMHSKGNYVDVTQMGTYDADTGVFKFNNADVSVSNKQSVAYVNGEMTGLSNKAVYVGNEKFYVPAELWKKAKEISDIKNEKIKISVDYNTGMVSVDGYTSEKQTPVSVVVTKPGKTLGGAFNTANIAYVDHIYTNKNGLYNFEFYTDILQGEYVFHTNYLYNQTNDVSEKAFNFKNLIPEMTVKSQGKDLRKMIQVNDGDTIDVSLSGFDMEDDFYGVVVIAQYRDNILEKVDYLDAKGGSALAKSEISKQAIIGSDITKIKIMYWDKSNICPITGSYIIQ